MLCKLLVPPRGEPGQHFAKDCDLLAKINNTTINAIWINGNMRTVCRLMAPLNSCQVGSFTEDLHTSEGKTSKSRAHRTKRKKLSVWQLASWNVRSL